MRAWRSVGEPERHPCHGRAPAPPPRLGIEGHHEGSPRFRRVGLLALRRHDVVLSQTTARWRRPGSDHGHWALKEVPCSQVPHLGSPLVVDLPGHVQTNLQEALEDGVALARYDCKTLEVLPDCSLPGKYTYMGTDMKEDVILLEAGDELGVNLPISVASVSVEARRYSAFELALRQVGKKRTAMRRVVRSQVPKADEKCQQATHYVRGAFLGAYAMRSRDARTASAAVDVFNFVTKVGTATSERYVRSGGEPARCAGANSSATAPPAGCGGILRLELKRIEDELRPADGAEDSDFIDCPAGLVRDGGKCTVSSGSTPHVCNSADAEDCKAQCSAGEPVSCGRLAYLLHYGREGRTLDLPEAARLYTKGCNGGDQFSCAGLGLFVSKGLGGLAKDIPRAVGLFEKSCTSGEARGCNNLAFHRSTSGDYVGAMALYDRACSGGWTLACTNLATFYETGRVVQVNRNEALRRYHESCEMADGLGCANLGHLGLRLRRMPLASAVSLFERGCNLGSPRACVLLGSYIQLNMASRVDARVLCRVMEENWDAIAKQPHDLFVRVRAALRSSDGVGACARVVQAEASRRGSDDWDPLAGCLMQKPTEDGFELCMHRHPAPKTEWSDKWDQKFVAAALRRACELGDATGCQLFAGVLRAFHSAGDAGETPEKYKQRACELAADCGLERETIEEAGAPPD